MKNKFYFLCPLLVTVTLFSGCSLGELTDRYLAHHDESDILDITAAPTQPPERIYMDELTGIIQGFDGSQLQILSNDLTYRFDISSASVETTHGIIPGDTVSVIYEGQLDPTDPSAVQILKVADELNQKTEMTEQVYFGKVIDITSNLLQVQGQDNSRILFSVPGCREYFQNGIAKDRWVYVHFLGTLPPLDPAGESAADGRYLKVTSVSDLEPFQTPAPTPTPIPDPENPAPQIQSMGGTIQSFSENTLSFVPYGSDSVLTVDLSALPCYFSGSPSERSGVQIFYTGEPKEAFSLSGLSLLYVIGDDPEQQKTAHIQSSVIGTVIGSTSDTATIQTSDGAYLICRTAGVPNTSTSNFEYGSSLRVTYNPAACRTTNILASLQLSDD